MLSRIAENIYWMARYLERAENTARLLDVNYYAMAEAPHGHGGAELVPGQWRGLLAMTGNEPAFFQHYAEADEASIVDWLVFRTDNPSSIRVSLQHARDNARSVRYYLNLEMWEAINRAYLALFVDGEATTERDQLQQFCAAVRETSHLFFGIADATLSRDLGWYFMQAGRYLERADNLLRLLTVRFGQGTDSTTADPILDDQRNRAFLRSIGAYEAFRKRFHASALDPWSMARFLLMDETFPRSVLASASALHAALEAIMQHNPAASYEPARRAGWYAAQLRYLPGAEDVIEKGTPSLAELLGELGRIADAVSQTFFVSGRLGTEQQGLQPQ